MKSVTMAAPRPPATPYITNITVDIAVARFAEIMPPVLAKIIALEPLSITPILNVRFSTPTTAYNIPTLGLNLDSKMSEVVMARSRRKTGAMSQ